MDPTLTNVTWQTLASVVGLAAFLAIVIVPAAKALGLTSRKGILAVALIAGQVFAQLAFYLLGGGITVKSATDALLVGLIAAWTASGQFETKKTILPGG